MTKNKVQIKVLNEGLGMRKDRVLGQYYLHAKQTYNGRPMKYPDTHFGHLSLYALRQEPLNCTLSTCRGFKVNETIA